MNMSLLSAITKSALRCTNRKRTERNITKAKKLAYKEVGLKIKDAKKKNKYINGSMLYKKNFSKRKAVIDRKYNFIENFISDL